MVVVRLSAILEDEKAVRVDGDDAVKALANKTPPCLLDDDDDDDDFVKNVNKACVMTHKTVARCIICYVLSCSSTRIFWIQNDGLMMMLVCCMSSRPKRAFVFER